MNRIQKFLAKVAYRYVIPDYIKQKFGYYLPASNDAGENVNPSIAERITTIFNAINVIAQDIAILDGQVMRSTKDGHEFIQNDPIERLMDQQPNPYMNAYHFKYCMTFLGESRGESFAWIERDGNGMPMALWPIHPDRIVRHHNRGVYWYEIQGVEFRTSDIFSFKTFSLDGWEGLSKINFNAQNIGLKIKTHKYKARAIGDKPPGYLTGNVSSEQAAQIGKGWTKKIQTGETPFLYGETVDYKQLMFTPEQTDLVLSEKWTDMMTLGIWRMQPVMVSIHEDSNYSNAEQQNIIHAKYTLSAAKVAWEQEINNKLFSERNKMSSNPKKFILSIDSLLKGDTATQMEKIRTLVTLGVWNGNDARKSLGMANIEGEDGTDYYIQGAMVKKGQELEAPSSQRALDEIEELIKNYKPNFNGKHVEQ